VTTADTVTGGWKLRNVDLRAYIGQTVDLQIRAETNSATNLSPVSSWYIDDVTFGASALPPQLEVATGPGQPSVKIVASTLNGQQAGGTDAVRLWIPMSR